VAHPPHQRRPWDNTCQPKSQGVGCAGFVGYVPYIYIPTTSMIHLNI
jgi:hypothetical protein